MLFFSVEPFLIDDTEQEIVHVICAAFDAERAAFATVIFGAEYATTVVFSVVFADFPRLSVTVIVAPTVPLAAIALVVVITLELDVIVCPATTTLYDNVAP